MTLIVGRAERQITGDELYTLYEEIDGYFTENHQKSDPLGKATHLLCYQSETNPEQTLTVSFNEANGILPVQAVTAVALTDAQREKLTEKLAKLYVAEEKFRRHHIRKLHGGGNDKAASKR